jgi:hypothetical protein
MSASSQIGFYQTLMIDEARTMPDPDEYIANPAKCPVDKGDNQKRITSQEISE